MPELTQYEQIKSKILSLQTAILESYPTLPIQLREIHSVLKNDPAIVTLLAPEEVATIVRGLEKQTNTYIASSMTKTSASKNKALSKVSSNDLGFD